ncbi:MAG: D-glycero-beta-D-manno-heptose-7-phosphate kinase [Acidithiobacillus sp.]|nr:D-glycero-beta-D-manno-heptose-7-phosphate kinase [Acidithiobacillus sp.]
MIPGSPAKLDFAILPSVDPERLATLARAHVAIVGDVMLDRYWFGRVERISPEAPVPVVLVQREEERPGGAANVALNVAALGARAVLRAPVGMDPAAERLHDLLARAGIDAQLLGLPDLPTTLKLRVIGQQQQLLRMDFEGAPEAIPADALWSGNCCQNAGALLLSDYGKGALTHSQPWIQWGRRTGVAVLVDPKGHDYERYRGATLLTPNKNEFRAAAGSWRTEEEFCQLAARKRVEWGLEALLVTRGEEGMSLFLADGVHHHAAQAREVYDVTGAGDTVIAVIATALAAGWNLDEAVELSNYAAGIVVGKLGAATVSVTELKQALMAHGL